MFKSEKLPRPARNDVFKKYIFGARAYGFPSPKSIDAAVLATSAFRCLEIQLYNVFVHFGDFGEGAKNHDF